MDVAQVGQVVRWAKRPLLTIPCAPGLVRRAAVKCYPGHTWKKRGVRAILGLAVRSGVGARLWEDGFPALGTLDGDSFQNWTATVTRRIGRTELHPVIVWPADPDRGRIYVHLLDAQGRPAAFAKLALDQSNSDLLVNESRTLQELRAMRLEQTHIPAVLDSGTLEGFAYVVVESVPPNAAIIDFDTDPGLAENIREYAGETGTLTPEQVAARHARLYRSMGRIVERRRNEYTGSLLPPALGGRRVIAIPKELTLGRIVATPAALEAIEASGQSPADFLRRHASKDWGDVGDEDKQLNDEALQDGSRILSAYHTSGGTKIWVITEAEDDSGQRAATTVLLPEEY